jgi:hypothetical protein
MPSNLTNVAGNATVQQLAQQTFYYAMEFIKSLNALVKALVVPLFVKVGIPASTAGIIIDIVVFLLFIWVIRSTTGKVKILLILLLIWFLAGAVQAGGIKWWK